MAHILFSHSYFLRYDPKQWGIGQPYPPLGTLYAAAVMRDQGFTVSLFDTMFATSPYEVTPVIANDNPSFFVIYDDGFNYLTKMCLTNMREAAFRMIKLAKEHGCTVVVCGSDSTDHFAAYLEEGADFVLLGEGEMTLKALLQAVEAKDERFDNINGLAYRKDESIVKTPARKLITDLDALPFPAWDLVKIEDYRKTWMNSKGYFSINVSTTRGCPFKCNWCAKPIYGNRYHARSPENVIQELKWLKQQFDFEHVWFCDDIFGLKPGWITAFRELLEKEAFSFRFKIQTRADLLLQQNTVQDLAAAGCEDAWIGAESGSQKILDAMDKGTTVAQIADASTMLRRYGVRPCFFIQFGYPGETIDDIRMTVKMINTLLPHEIGISVSYPLPGTVFYQKVKAELEQKANWTDSNEMAMMFRNTYKPAFYKHLHKYIHRNYRKHLAFANLRRLLKHPFGGNFAIFKKAISCVYYAPAVFFDSLRLKQLQKP